jgi:general secretion pathway protein A
MYLRFYNLREFPFAITCDGRFYYESPAHAEAMANMVYAVQQQKGMVLITGEVGAGKTFLGAMLASRLGAGCTTVHVNHPPKSAMELARALAARTDGDEPPTADRMGLLAHVEDFLVRMHNRGRIVAVVLDEAQDMTPATLDELRLLWNWERDSRRLAQIVLIGQPDLRQRLKEPRWESLRQRISLKFHLGPLSAADGAAYVAHRLRVAADGEAGVEFTPRALADIHAAAGGIPRVINTLCDNALLIGYARGVRCIDEAVVGEVVREML